MAEKPRHGFDDRRINLFKEISCQAIFVLDTVRGFEAIIVWEDVGRLRCPDVRVPRRSFLDGSDGSGKIASFCADAVVDDPDRTVFSESLPQVSGVVIAVEPHRD
jgi:hypothetical protein